MRQFIETDFNKTYDELNIISFVDQIKENWPNRELLISSGAETSWQSLSTKENLDSGIYVIKRIDNNRLYIGKAAEFENRRRPHFYGKVNDSKRLHDDINGIRNKYTTNEEADKAVGELFF